MSQSVNRAALLSKVHKVLKKHYKPVESPSDRKVLEQLLFAALLENADFETAQEGFARLQESYFDWNEVRVTTIAELAEMLAGFSDAADAAQRVKKTLQGVFETYYLFDLEPLRKQNLGKSVADIEKMAGVSPFMIAYLTQTALGGHAIPLGRGAWDVLMAVGAATESDWQKLHVAGMERAIQKNKGVEFFSLLHQCGVDLASSPQSTRVKGILAEIDAGARERLSQWQQRKLDLEKQVAQQLAADKAAAARKLAEKPPEPPSGKKQKGKAGGPEPSRPPEAKRNEGKGGEAKAAEGKGTEAKRSDAKPVEGKSSDSKAPAVRPTGKGGDAKSPPPKTSSSKGPPARDAKRAKPKPEREKPSREAESSKSRSPAKRLAKRKPK